MSQSVGSQVSERLSRLESESHATRSDLERLIGVVERLARDLQEHTAKAGRANWGVLVAFGSLLLAFVASVGAPYVQRQDRLVQRIDQMDAELLRRSDRFGSLERSVALLTYMAEETKKEQQRRTDLVYQIPEESK